MVRTGWEKDMEALCAHTAKNWWKTGNRNCSAGVTGTIELGTLPKVTKEKKTLDKVKRTS